MDITGREKAIRILENGNKKLEELFDQLSDEQMQTPATVGGGDWSAKDLMGHIASWERYSLESIAEIRAGNTPSIDAVLAEPGGTDKLNAEAIAAGSGIALIKVREAAAGTHARLVAEIDGMLDDEWQKPYLPDVPGLATIGQLIGTITSGPEAPFAHADAHLKDLGDYVASLATTD